MFEGERLNGATTTRYNDVAIPYVTGAGWHCRSFASALPIT